MDANSTAISVLPTNGNRLDCVLMSIDFENIERLPDSVAPTWIFLSVINGIASPLTVSLNLLVIWTVLEEKRLRSANYNIFLVALAVTDLLVGLVAEPLIVCYLGCLLLKCSSPCLWFSLFILSSIGLAFLSMCTLMAMTVERYIAIEHPMYYRRVITNTKVIAAIAILWITEPTAYILGRMSTDSSETIRKLPTAVFVGSNALVILLCTIKVQMTAHRQRRAIAIAGQTTAQREEQQSHLKEYKLTFTMSLMVLASVILYCPMIIVIIVETFKGKEVTDDFKYISTPMYLFFVYLQSLVNPNIFSLRLSYIREGVRKKLFC